MDTPGDVTHRRSAFRLACSREELPIGEMVGIDVGGGRVLLAHLEDGFFAISGVCTHEDANLDEGELFDGEVTCPLHLATFDVRSGAALTPPATSPVAVYPVEVRCGKVFVGDAAVPGGSGDG